MESTRIDNRISLSYSYLMSEYHYMFRPCKAIIRYIYLEDYIQHSKSYE